MLSFLHLSVAPLLKFQLLYIMIMTITATNTMRRMVAYTFVLCRDMSVQTKITSTFYQTLNSLIWKF